MSAAQLACLMFAAPFLALALIFGVGLVALPFIERRISRRSSRWDF
jgi:peptidoglycan/LPS O-acetylase OafA/YrhL